MDQGNPATSDQASCSSGDHELKKWKLLEHLPNEFLSNVKIAKVGKFDKGSKDCAFLVTSEDKVYVLGDNDHNLLALGDVESARQLTESEQLNNREIIDIVTGNFCACALTVNGQVLTWGSNKWGMLGNGSDKSSSKVHLVQGPLINRHVRQIVMTETCVLCLTSDDKLFGWGKNNPFLSEFASKEHKAQLHLLAPLEIELPDREEVKGICAIYCANLTAYILKADGSVFAWGSNKNYLLGDGLALRPQQRDLRRVSISTEIKIIMLCPNQFYTLALSEEGDVFVWGEKEGLCVPTEDLKNKHPTKIAFRKDPVKAVVKSPLPLSGNTFVVETSLSVFSWDLGSNKFSRLSNCQNIEEACATLDYGMLGTWRKNDTKQINHPNDIHASKVAVVDTGGYPEALEKREETKYVTTSGQENVIGDNNEFNDHSQNKTLRYNSHNFSKTQYNFNIQQLKSLAPAIGYYSTIPRNNIADEITFVGLEKYLLEMGDWLAKTNDRLEEYSCTVLVLHGMIGSGKTALADAFLREKSTSARYANRIIINAESLESIKASFLELIKGNNLETRVSDADPVDVIVQAVYKHLLQKPTLILFDAAKKFNTATTDDDYNLTRLLPFRSEIYKKPTIIVTTRVAQTAEKTLNVRKIHIAPLNAEDSLKLSEKLCSDFSEISLENRKMLVTSCGYNPLAIECCMGNIRNSRNHQAQPKYWDSAVIVRSETLGNIIREFEEIRMLPNGQSISSIAVVRAALDVDIISVNYFKEVFVRWDVTEKEFDEAVELLGQFSIFDEVHLPLVSMNHLMRVACIELMYPLVSNTDDLTKQVMNYMEYVLVQIMPSEMALQKIVAWSDVIIMLASSMFFRGLTEGSSVQVQLVTEIMPNLVSYDAERCWMFFEKQVSYNMWILINPNSAMQLLWCLVNVSGWTNYSKNAATSLFSSPDSEKLRAISLWHQNLKMDHWLTGRSHCMFDKASVFQNILESDGQDSKGMDIKYYLDTLAFAGSPRHFFKECDKLMETDTYSAFSSDLKSSIGVATTVALFTQGKIVEASELCSRKLTEHSWTLSDISFSDLGYIELLARLLSDVGVFNDALKHIEVVCKCYRQLHGSTSIQFLRAVTLKSEILCSSGFNEEALTLLESTLDVLRARSDLLHPDNHNIEDHPFVLYLRQHIGKHLYKQGLYSKALAVLQDVFDRQLKSVGSDSFYTMESMYLIGRTHRDSGSYQLSSETFSKLLVFGQRVRYSERNAHVLKYAIGQASNQIKSGETTKAKESLQLIVKTAVEENFWRHWCEAQVLLAAIEDGAEAKKILTEVLEMSVKLMGPKHKNTLRYQLELVKILWQEGNSKESEAEIELVLMHIVPNYGEDNVSTLPWLNLKALVLCDLGKVDEALLVQKKVVEFSEKRVETPDHLEVFRNKYDLCLILGESGRETEALEMLHDLMKTTVYSKCMKYSSRSSEVPDEVELTTLLAFFNFKISPLTALVLSRLTFQSAVAKMSSSRERCMQLVVNHGLIAYAMQRKDEAIQTVHYARSLYADQPQEISTALEAKLKVVVNAADKMDTPSHDGATQRVSNERLKFRRGGKIELISNNVTNNQPTNGHGNKSDPNPVQPSKFLNF